jgi:hypothetical protein
MGKPKRKLTAEQRRIRRKRRSETMIIFVNGRQKRVPRLQQVLVEGIPVDEFIEEYADEIWLMENGYYEILHARAMERSSDTVDSSDAYLPRSRKDDEFDQLPF